MKYMDEFRDPYWAKQLAKAITEMTTRSWRIMEACGGQTHAILRFGIDQLLPPELELIHGPGCPVCVTPIEMIDRAIEIAQLPKVIFCSFGDMLRVPGNRHDLLSAKAMGADVRPIYSPLDAVRLARDNPQREVVFFAVGFETTVPANAMAVYQASLMGLSNFSVLVSQALVPPAIQAILSSKQNRVQGFLAAGHVCTVMGYEQYEPLSTHYRVPIVVTGFEPVDILQGIYLCVRQLEQGLSFTENQYTRSVKRAGNRSALDLINEVFEISSSTWRGIGKIPESGLKLKQKYGQFDAHEKFTLKPIREASSQDTQRCLSGLILQGLKKPFECPEFGKSCTPEYPLGATMVSSEGACAAYYRYRRTPMEKGYARYQTKQ